MGATAVTPAVPPRRGPLAGVSARLLRVASDEKLVAAVRQGSQPAFEVVYDRHARGILSFCRHMLGSREEAEDAVQHTFMAAYKALLASDKDIQLKAWLYTIARNRCLSVLRARREQPSDEIEIASFDGLAEEVQRKGELQDMLRDLAELPEDQRAALVLSEIGDLGHDEIGDVLDVPKDKVKALVFQARSSLQQSREARDTSCEEIREMLATLSGGALRRTTLRRHIKECPGCQVFEAEVKRQRRAMAAVLPVIPTVGLKDSALAAAFGQAAAGGAAVAGGAAAAGAGGAAAGGSLLGGGASALVAKVLVVTAVAGGGAAGVSAVSDGGGADTPRSTPAVERTAPSPGGTPAAPITPAATAEAENEREQNDKVAEDKPRKDKKARERGKKPEETGKALAETRGKGKKNGLRGTQPGKTKADKVEKAKEKAEKRKAREKSAEQKATGKAKEKAKTNARRERPAKRPVKPSPQPREEKPKNENSQKPESKPEATPEPTPVPTVKPGDEGGSEKSAPGRD